MKLTPLQKRAERRNRHKTMVDLNLVSLIDVFTILIFFLLSNAGGIELLPSPKAVKLPESESPTAPRPTVVVAVSASAISIDDKPLASVADAMATPGDLIVPLQSALAATMHGEAKGQALTIMGDKSIPYQLLRKVMATAASAGYTDVSFAVRQRHGA